MRKVLLAIYLLFCSAFCNGQFTIFANGPIDVCFPASVTLQVDNPLPGYNYIWNIGSYQCPGSSYPAVYGYGTSIQAMATGEFYCQAFPTGGGNPLISNPISVRVLPGSAGSILMPAPGLGTGNYSCVGSASLCVPDVFWDIWPGTIINWYRNNAIIGSGSSGNYTATVGGYYKYSITSSCLTAYSDSTFVSVKPLLNTVHSNLKCFQSGKGKASAIAHAGIAPYNYQWNTVPVQSTNSIKNLYAGIYICTITDSEGCSQSKSISLSEPSELVLMAIPTNPNPSGTSTGQIDLTVGGGTGPYKYLWTNGSTTEDLNGIAGGIYYCLVRDKNKCAKLISAILTN